jgi:hypothetical protein
LNVFFTAGTLVDSSQNQINIVDNVTYVTGGHQLKFGLDFRRLNPVFAPSTARSLTFSNEDNVVNGVLNSYRIAARLTARPQFDNVSLFAQDAWKVSKRLTLDLGLRWEFNPPPSERDGKMPTVITGIVGSDVSHATLAPVGTRFYNTYYTAFAPRFGAAYLLRGKPGNETVLRGGFGVYYDLGSGVASRAWPFETITALSGIPFPVSPANAAEPPVTAVNRIALNKDLKLPYSLQWNLAAEQSLGKSQTLSLSYVASAGRRLLSTQTVNQQVASPTGVVLIPRPNPNFGDIMVTNSNASSDYHSAQMQYKARLKDTLQALVNYTWSHAIDNLSMDAATGVLERGNANFDVRHNLSAAVHYELPRLKVGGPVGYLLRDWSADLIVHAQSGLPIDIASTTSGAFLDGIQQFVRPDFIPGIPIEIEDPTVPGGRRFNTAAFRLPAPECLVPPAGGTCVNVIRRQGTFGRNVLRQLPIYQADVALGRTFRLNERLNLQLKGEVFNVFNHPQFFISSGGGTDFGNATAFGVPTGTLSGIGGMNALHQIGGARSIQLSARLAF